jgi:type II pantothenate kinase
MSFETERIDRCIDFIQQLKQDHERLNGSAPDELCVIATGGGAYKYYDRLKQTLNVDIMREEEMDCLITGTPLPIPFLPTSHSFA